MLRFRSLDVSALGATVFNPDDLGGGHNGMLFARLDMPGTGCRFDLHEVIDTRLGHDARESYSYSLVCDGRAAWRWDRDPWNHREMPDHEHVHGAPNVRRPCTVTLAQALDASWSLSGDGLR